MDLEHRGRLERRHGGDRRLHIRGGRRRGDQLGYTPLVFVVTDEPSHLRFWEALLLNLKFAVVPCAGPEPAFKALRALRPDVIVVSPRDITKMRDRLQSDRPESAIPVVELVTTPDFVEPVIRAIRGAVGAMHKARQAASR
jgi:hypothetical protein